MIRLSPDFTYYGLVFCDCTGLMICPDDMEPHRGINLRSAAEVARCAEWLRHLYPPAELPSADVLTLPGFSPERADESFEGHYDATELHLYGVWRMDQDGLCFHLAAETSPDPETPSFFGLDATGIPFTLLPHFAGALEVIAKRMADDSLDLTEDQPLKA